MKKFVLILVSFVSTISLFGCSKQESVDQEVHKAIKKVTDETK